MNDETPTPESEPDISAAYAALAEGWRKRSQVTFEQRIAALEAKVAEVPAYDPGHHNRDLDAANARLITAGAWKDVSTAIIIPTRGELPTRFVQCLMNLGEPMNQAKQFFLMPGFTCAEAYELAVNALLRSQRQWKYVLTIEDDVLFPTDGWLKLLEAMDQEVDGVKFDIISGLCWTKGFGGQPMVFGGDPNDPSIGWFPIPPIKDHLQPVYFTPLGFTLIRFDVFRALKPPYFMEGTAEDGQPANVTVDAYFCAKAAKAGFKCAVDTRVLLGHLDRSTGKVW